MKIVSSNDKYFGFMAKEGDSEDGIAYENKIRRNKQEKEYVKRIRLSIRPHS